jgi:hypothetical protein
VITSEDISLQYRGDLRFGGLVKRDGSFCGFWSSGNEGVSKYNVLVMGP